LADYLTKYKIEDFEKLDDSVSANFDVVLNDKGYPASWDDIYV
jgi:hypothetical protein